MMRCAAILASCAVALVILLCSVDGSSVQVGARFPRGIQVGNGTEVECNSEEATGFLRYENAEFQYCNGSSWIPLSGAHIDELNDIRSRLSTLENDIGSPVSIEGLREDVREGNRLNSIIMCNKNGVFNSQTFVCDCNCDPVVGCWDSLRDCSECYVGWEGEFCTTDVSAPSLSLAVDHNAVLLHEAGEVFVPPSPTSIDNKDGDISSNVAISHDIVDVRTRGTYHVTYESTDAAGNQVSLILEVEIIDTTSPVLELDGSAVVTVEAGTEYSNLFDAFPATVTDNADDPLTIEWNATAIDFDEIGVYTVEYTCTDVSGNTATPIFRTIHIIDTTSPVLSVVGSATVSWKVGYTYVDDGAEATDNANPRSGSELNAGIVAVSTVDSNTLGVYNVTYSLTDASGNVAAEISRAVHIIEIAGSCDEIQDENPSATSGVFTVSFDGPLFETYCMFTSTGGYDLLFNLNSRDTTIRSFLDDDFWTTSSVVGNIASPLTSEAKSAAFSHLGLLDLRFVYHSSWSTQYGYSEYRVRDGYQGRSLLDLMQNESDLELTSSKRSSSIGTSMGLVRNTNREQSLYGDIFLHFNDPVVVNKMSGWNACLNKNRLATTLTNNDYSHTMAGIGGHHMNGCSGSWSALYENQPIYAYCDGVRGYGSSSTFTQGSSTIHPDGAYHVFEHQNCKHSSFQWVPVDVAVFARWKETTMPRNCEEVRLNSQGESLLDGTYEVEVDGVIQETYCVFRNGFGFDLLMTLNTGDSVVRHYDDTDFWLTNSTHGSIDSPRANEYKGSRYGDMQISRIYMEVHNGGSTTYGSAQYSLLEDYTGRSLLGIMTSETDAVFTSAREANGGNGRSNTGVIHNSYRPQSAYGDVFLDYSNALVVNSQSRWNACRNQNRLVNTLTNTEYGHTFGGIGGYHENGCGSWGVKYEYSNIISYCDAVRGYGTEAGNYYHPSDTNSHFPLRPSSGYPDSCQHSSFSYRPVDISIFALGV